MDNRLGHHYNRVLVPRFIIGSPIFLWSDMLSAVTKQPRRQRVEDGKEYAVQAETLCRNLLVNNHSEIKCVNVRSNK